MEMKSKSNISLFVPILSVSFLFFCSPRVLFAEEQNAPLYGSFIQPWLYAEWSDEQWDRECAALKSVGVEAVILGWTAKREHNASHWETSYPSKIPGTKMKTNDIKPLFKYAGKHGLKVYMGLGLDDDWWNWNLSKAWDAEKFKDTMRMSAKIAKEIYEMYQPEYPDQFAGFFCTYEIWNHVDWDRKPLRDLQAERFADGFNLLIKTLDEIAPEMPLLFSPFSTVERYADISSTRAFYDSFLRKTHFRKQDGMLPMDNVGGGGQTLETVERWAIMYATAVKDSGNKLNCYANVENFVESRQESINRSGNTSMVILEGDDYIGSAPIARFLEQIDVAKRHATKLFSFSYSHYYGPVNNIPGFHAAFLRYRQTGEKDSVFPVAPAVVIFAMANAEVAGSSKTVRVLRVSWEGASDDFGISRVNLYRGEKLVSHHFAIRRDGEWSISEPKFLYYPEFRQDHADYRLGVVDVWGNETKTKPFKIDPAKGRVNLK